MANEREKNRKKLHQFLHSPCDYNFVHIYIVFMCHSFDLLVYIHHDDKVQWLTYILSHSTHSIQQIYLLFAKKKKNQQRLQHNQKHLMAIFSVVCFNYTVNWLLFFNLAFSFSTLCCDFFSLLFSFHAFVCMKEINNTCYKLLVWLWLCRTIRSLSLLSPSLLWLFFFSSEFWFRSWTLCIRNVYI